MTEELKQLKAFPKKFIVEVHELVTYKFEVDAEDGWDAQEKGMQAVEDWNGSNTTYLIKREPYSCTKIIDEAGKLSYYSD